MAKENEIDKPEIGKPAACVLGCPLCGNAPPAELAPVADLILAGSLSPFIVRCMACGVDYDPQEQIAHAL